MLYPLKFHPIFKEKIWGGQKIKTILEKDFSPLPNCGESWEISGVEDNISVVREGPLAGRDLKSLISEFKEELIGKRIYERFETHFPLLIKFIDANEDLSIQVHPDDRFAFERHGTFGKTEMWYIVHSDPQAKLISGFNRPISREIYMEFFNQGKLVELLNEVAAEQGDIFFIPAGRIHTIGKGLLIAEIQQTSDVTYRIYDFDRIDKNGRARELHVEEALDVMDYQYYDNYKVSYNEKINTPLEVVSCEYFTTSKLVVEGLLDRTYNHLDSFVILIDVEGEGIITCNGKKTSVSLGDVILIPNNISTISIESKDGLKLLETFVAS
jgi:mannose-6-phosphate isomerase